MTKSILIPINNVSAKGDYCAEVDIGQPPQPQHLIVDTGSSTLVVNQHTYNGTQDKTLAPTTYLQHMRYGMGDWVGPVVHSSVHLGEPQSKVRIEEVAISVAEVDQENTFASADGIFGLAYKALNHAHDAAVMLANLDLEHTWPWNTKLAEKVTEKDFAIDLQHQPDSQITPLFTALAEQNVVPDQFAFLVHRSSIFQTDSKKTESELVEHPLNRGILAVGNPHLHTHLHKCNYQHVKVLDDKYYNVELLSIEVKGQVPIPAPRLSEKQKQRFGSNAIVDSGASAIVLPPQMFDSLFWQLCQYNPKFSSILESFKVFTGKEQGIPIQLVDLDEWPDIAFQLTSIGQQPVTLVLSPHSYWQTHAPQSNQISFKLTTLPNWGAQAILGLPLLCEYYSIFDRRAEQFGVISFADKHIAPHRLHDSIHNNLAKLTQIFEQHKLHSNK